MLRELEDLKRLVDGYVADAMTLTMAEESAVRTIVELMPAEVIDSHVHTSTWDHLEHPLADTTLGHMMSTFPAWSVEESKKLHEALWGRVTIRAVRFPHVFRELDRRSANRYVVEHASYTDIPIVIGVLEDVTYTTEILSHREVRGLKMYPHDAGRPRSIDEYFPSEMMRHVDRANKAIVLHLPASVEGCADEVVDFASRYPNSRIVLAHCGLVHTVRDGVDDAYRVAAAAPNVFVDTARVENVDVLRLVLRHFGVDRTMFGSDEPLSLLRSRAYMHPSLGERIVSPSRYHWTALEEWTEYKHLAAYSRLSLIEQTSSLVAAILSECGDPRQAIEWVFAGTAKKVFNLA